MRNPKPEIRNPKPETLLYESRSPEDTERLAEVFAGHLKGGEVLALAGNLGAGKTCFARGLARGLGIPGPITSPSYVLVKSYEGRLTLHHGDFYRLAGAPDRATDDAKRAETGAEVGAAHDGRDGARGRAADSAAADGGAATGRAAAERQDSAPSSEPPDLASLGLEDYLDDPNAVVLIEWADRYPAWLEPPFYLVEITGSGEASRWILARRIEVSS